MSRHHLVTILVLVTVIPLVISCRGQQETETKKPAPTTTEDSTETAAPTETAVATETVAAAAGTTLHVTELAFRNAVNEPPEGWTGNVFKLSHDYPSEKPAPPEGGYPWEAFDFKAQPAEYMQAVLDYARKDLEPVDWNPTKLDKPNWFHAPWMAQGEPSGNGREFIHGMTNERASRAGELSKDQTKSYLHNVAVGFYNDVGGWTFGRVWADPGKPDFSNGKANFENGTMAIKLLFTAADPAVPDNGVPYLKNSKEWQANMAPHGSNVRQPKTVRLLQVDIAVRDKRNDDVTGWLLGTFVYNGNKPGDSPFDRLAPVGLMWGDSPGVKPNGDPPAEQWINTEVGTYQHLGWAGRLNGPVDNPASSCMSCHGSAETPKIDQMLPPRNSTDEQKLAWFTNVKSGVAKSGGEHTSLDYSLQMAVAVQNWRKWDKAAEGTEYPDEHPVDRGEEPRE